jgi:predicted small lipoprotein YifL
MTFWLVRAQGYCIIAIFAAALFALPACGRKGPPLPPRPVVPAAVGNLQAEPREAGIVLSWTRPTLNNDNSSLTDLLEFRLFRPPFSRHARRAASALACWQRSGPINRRTPASRAPVAYTR